MTSISSVSPLNAASYVSSAASSIGQKVSELADADSIGTASAIVSLSEEGLAWLKNAGEAVSDTAQALVDGTETAIGSAVDDVKNGITEMAGDVSSLAERGWDAVGNAASSVESTISDAASAAIDGVGSAASSLASYAVMGTSAVAQVVNAFA